MKVPTHLQHQPVIAVNDYDKHDGIYRNGTDARALSIGRAQYDSGEFSAKVFRHTGSLPPAGSNLPPDGKWSRQSEELPLHRVLDLAILLVGVMKRDRTDEPSFTPLSEVVISPSEFNNLKSYLKNSKHIQKKLGQLKTLL